MYHRSKRDNFLSLFPLIIFALIIGVNVSAMISESEMMMDTIHPSCLNITPAKPPTMVIGRNTAMMVSVEAITERDTSSVPYTAACFGRLPRCIWVVIFSSTTMASSTTMPMVMESAEREMMLMELPVR